MDSGASYHLICLDDVSEHEKKSLRDLAYEMSFATANGKADATQEIKIWVNELHCYVWAIVMDSVPPVLSLGKLCADEGYEYVWKGVKRHFLKDLKGRKIFCTLEHNCPMICPAPEVHHDEPDAPIEEIEMSENHRLTNLSLEMTLRGVTLRSLTQGRRWKRKRLKLRAVGVGKQTRRT